MPVRTSMQDLILRVRDRIGDNPADETTRVWTDQQIQDALDRERVDVVLGELRQLVGRYSLPSGVITWTDYFDRLTDWESDAKLYNGSFSQLTPASSDYLVGHWTFATDTPPPVYIAGKTYDIASAGADIVQQWIALASQQYDFGPMRGVTFNVSQKRDGLLKLLDMLRSERRTNTVRMIRRDATGAFGW